VGGLDKAGLSYVAQQCLFSREEAALLWDELDRFKTNEMRGLDIEGCPGVGKSCEVWAWLGCESLRCEDTDRNFALWVHLYPDLPAACTIFRRDYLLWTDKLEVSMVKTLEKSVECDVIVLDGVRVDQRDAEIRASAFASSVDKIISVKSLAGKRYVESDAMNRISPFEVYPWTKNQYERAVAFLDFRASVLPFFYSERNSDLSLAELVERKFYYAGGSARWMFTKSIEQVVQEIDGQVSGIRDVEGFLLNRVGITNQDNINHLMVRYRSGKTFTNFLISKYVASLLLEKCEASVFKVAYSLASTNENPSFTRWIVEFDFISQIRRSLNRTIKLITEDDAEVEWSVPDLISFDPDSQIGALPLGTWFKPTKWNQEGYDLVGLFKDQPTEIHYLRFVQVTNAEEHDANLLHFRRLAVKVAASLGDVLGVEIVMVSPVGNIPTKIKVKNENALQEFRIKDSQEKWLASNVKSSILQYFFNKQNGMTI
jgi:hypothetical protein